MTPEEQKKADDALLAKSLVELLTGELKLGLNMLAIGKSVTRNGRDTAWVTQGLAQWVNATDESIPLLAAALGAKGVERLKQYLAGKSA